MVLSQTEQGKGILRQRLLRRMFTLDALPGSLENNGHPLAPFSVNAEGARTCGLASIDNLIKRHPATSPTTVTLAISLLDRFLLKACRHLTQNPAPTQTDWKHARPFPIWASKLRSPMHLATPTTSILLRCVKPSHWRALSWRANTSRCDCLAAASPTSPTLILNAHCPCASKDVHDAELPSPLHPRLEHRPVVCHRRGRRARVH